MFPSLLPIYHLFLFLFSHPPFFPLFYLFHFVPISELKEKALVHIRFNSVPLCPSHFYFHFLKTFIFLTIHIFKITSTEQKRKKKEKNIFITTLTTTCTSFPRCRRRCCHGLWRCTSCHLSCRCSCSSNRRNTSQPCTSPSVQSPVLGSVTCPRTLTARKSSP